MDLDSVRYLAPRYLRFQCLVPILLLVVSPATGQQLETGTRYALLIGIGAYEQWPSLVNPIPDVRALETELRIRYGFLAEVLENPRQTEILGKLRRYLAKSYGPDDQLVIVFAGHGAYDEVTRIGYLAARDSASRGRDPNFGSLIAYPLLLTLIDNIPCQNILLIVDACFSGSLRGYSGVVAGREPDSSASRHVSRRFLTSGGTEYVPDGDPDRHTPFVRQLLAGLRSPGRGDVLTLEELERAFMSRVEPRPRWGSFGNGRRQDFALVARGPAPAVSAPHVPTARPPSPTARPPVPAPAASADSRLRARPAKLSEHELERAFQRGGFYHAVWHIEGDYPNQLRTQRSGLWDVVIDLESGLMWQQAGSDRRLSHDEAAAYILKLNRSRHGGHADWRLPTLVELGSLLEPESLGSTLFINSAFDAEQETCWSADRDLESSQPYYVSFHTGRTVLAYGAKKAFVRAVRNN